MFRRLYIVAQSFTNGQFRRPSLRRVIIIRHWLTFANEIVPSLRLHPLSLVYLFLSLSFSFFPYPFSSFLASVRPLAVFIAIIETHGLQPSSYSFFFFFFRGFRQWAESLCLAGRVVNLATLLPPLRSDLAHLIPLAEGRERRG